MRDLIVSLHRETFHASPELKHLVCGDGLAAVEAVFVATHVSDFAGIPATGAEVRVPYTVFYDVAGAQITALRAYLSMLALTSQLPAAAEVTA
ncbi:ester cyclase [Nocardioides sp. WL0053]|uniref:Ester cyclase n=1 Tax=Nocardioides jiangsuensis TaxID=2866161 RepID=A0ABS7RJJ0_9ACTN|nr:ester cyclase [Nocardioides jiangsuensis]